MMKELVAWLLHLEKKFDYMECSIYEENADKVENFIWNKQFPNPWVLLMFFNLLCILNISVYKQVFYTEKQCSQAYTAIYIS